jgi:hypothetical protein
MLGPWALYSRVFVRATVPSRHCWILRMTYMGCLINGTLLHSCTGVSGFFQGIWQYWSFIAVSEIGEPFWFFVFRYVFLRVFHWGFSVCLVGVGFQICSRLMYALNFTFDWWSLWGCPYTSNYHLYADDFRLHSSSEWGSRGNFSLVCWERLKPQQWKDIGHDDISCNPPFFIFWRYLFALGWRWIEGLTWYLILVQDTFWNKHQFLQLSHRILV